MDCLWRLSDWTQLREQLNSNAAKGGAVEESPALLMTRAYLALQEGHVQEADTQTNRALLAALHRWWALPDLPSHSTHVGLLQTFQQLVELKVGARGGDCKYRPKLNRTQGNRARGLITPARTSGAQAEATDERDNTYGRGPRRGGLVARLVGVLRGGCIL
mgnify:CR=1 FL=1